MNRRLYWDHDAATEFWARKCSVRLPRVPTPQYAGENRRAFSASWTDCILQGAFPAWVANDDGTLDQRPETIVRCFREGLVLEGLTLTVAWGSMARTKPKVYSLGLPQIRREFLAAQRSIQREHAVSSAWDRLGRILGWSPVIASKVLHFLCRGLGYTANPPVPFDRLVVNGIIWPAFKKRAGKEVRHLVSSPELPRSWVSASAPFTAYTRYMTAIIVWAGQRRWSSTQLENSLFHAATRSSLF